jgi:IrrE N-terminal-like domain
VTYIPDSVLENRAGQLWHQYNLVPAFDIEALADDLDLSLLWEEVRDDPAHSVLGQLDPNDARIILNQRHFELLEAGGGRVRRYTIAHEIGHWLFHCNAARTGALSLFQDGRIWCRAGDAHPAERQAEMFAARLLMPSFTVRPLVPRTPWSGWKTVRTLADRFLVSLTAMRIRLEELGLAHLDPDGVPTSGQRTPTGQTQLF